jgi:hypothetical protein
LDETLVLMLSGAPEEEREKAPPVCWRGAFITVSSRTRIEVFAISQPETAVPGEFK